MARTKTTYRKRPKPYAASKRKSYPDIPTMLQVPLNASWQHTCLIPVKTSVQETWETFIGNPLSSAMISLVRIFINAKVRKHKNLTTQERFFLEADGSDRLNLIPAYSLLGLNNTQFQGFDWLDRTSARVKL